MKVCVSVCVGCLKVSVGVCGYVKANECVICVIMVEEGNGELCIKDPVSLGSSPNDKPLDGVAKPTTS